MFSQTGLEDGFRMISDITFVVHFISIIIASVLPQVILEFGDRCSRVYPHSEAVYFESSFCGQILWGIIISPGADQT